MKDPEKKNKLLKISKPEGYVDPNEIDLLREEGSFIGDDGKVHLQKTDKKPEPEPEEKQEGEKFEKDLFKFVLNFNNRFKPAKKNGPQILTLSGQSDKQPLKE